MNENWAVRGLSLGVAGALVGGLVGGLAAAVFWLVNGESFWLWAAFLAALCSAVAGGIAMLVVGLLRPLFAQFAAGSLLAGVSAAVLSALAMVGVSALMHGFGFPWWLLAIVAVAEGAVAWRVTSRAAWRERVGAVAAGA